MFALTVPAVIVSSKVFSATDHKPSNNVVRIEVTIPGSKGASIGSGVILADGTIVTANHVIADERSADDAEAAPQIISVATEGGVVVKARVLWADADNDIALLSSDYSGTGQLVCHRPLTIGQRIEAVGNPLDLGFVHSWGRVSSKPRSFEGKWKKVVLAQIAVAPGNSGGPVYDTYGHVVGIVVGMITAPMGWFALSTGLATIVPSQTICGLIAAHHRVSAPGV